MDALSFDDVCFWNREFFLRYNMSKVLFPNKSSIRNKTSLLSEANILLDVKRETASQTLKSTLFSLSYQYHAPSCHKAKQPLRFLAFYKREIDQPISIQTPGL